MGKTNKTPGLGDRMKSYENVNRFYLTRRMPLIIRIDGRAFHTFCRGFKKPYDRIFAESMQATALNLCKNIEGCKLAYTQSDEISLLLTDYDELNTQAWFDKNLQKIVSISASLATLYFNKSFKDLSEEWCKNHGKSYYSVWNDSEEDDKYYDVLRKAQSTATFDSRAFCLPKEEVANYYIWRQKDATRNSINSLAQANFSHKSLQGLNVNQVQDKLVNEKGINWNDQLTEFKRGICCVKTEEGWKIDKEIPVFTEDRNYIERFI